MTHEASGKLLELAVDFTTWDTPTLAAQCRMQARENLDPEYTRFMEEVAARLSTPSPDLKADNAALVWPSDAQFQHGAAVQKKGRASWRGHIVGWYRTSITALGYAVESAFEPGSVQIYPEGALELWEPRP